MPTEDKLAAVAEVHKAFDNLIAFNLQWRKRFLESLMHFGGEPAAFIYSHCAVHLDPGRGTGKTSYIAKNFNPLTDVIVTFGEHHASIVRQRIRELRDEDLGKYEWCILVNWQLMREEAINVNNWPKLIRNVWVDEPEMVFSKNSNGIGLTFRRLVEHIEPRFDKENGTVILLGS